MIGSFLDPVQLLEHAESIQPEAKAHKEQHLTKTSKLEKILKQFSLHAARLH